MKLQAIRFEHFNSLLNILTQISKMSLCSLRVVIEEDCKLYFMTITFPPSQKGNTEMELLMEAYKDLLREPQGLTPSRLQDHSIPLKERAQHDNIRLYIHSRLQKDEIIQHRNNPFAFPVILVKKKDNS